MRDGQDSVSDLNDFVMRVHHHAWPVGVIAGGIAAMDPSIVGFMAKLGTAAAMAFITGGFYTAGLTLSQKLSAWWFGRKK